MHRVRHVPVACRFGYVGHLHVGLDQDPVLQPFEVTLYLEPKSASSDGMRRRKGIGKISFGLFKPQSFPGRPLPYRLGADLTSPLRELWAKQRPVLWLKRKFPKLRPEFLVFASVEVAPFLAGRRLGLAAMADIINRQLPPGGIAVLNPYPLQYLGTRFDGESGVTPGEIHEHEARLKQHYARLGFMEAEQGLLVLQRTETPLAVAADEPELTLEEFSALPDVADYHGQYR